MFIPRPSCEDGRDIPEEVEIQQISPERNNSAHNGEQFSLDGQLIHQHQPP